jgi:hypothetical protein
MPYLTFYFNIALQGLSAANRRDPTLGIKTSVHQPGSVRRFVYQPFNGNNEKSVRDETLGAAATPEG